jgi:two-component system, NarL family, sensor kinase
MNEILLDSSNEELIVTFVSIFIVFICLSAILLCFFYYSRKKIIKQEIEKKNIEIKYQKDLLHSVLITQEKERKRIAQDLHDDISSKLNVVSINSHLLKTNNLSDLEKLEITENIIALTNKALHSSRQIAHDLMPPVLEKFGLNAAIEELVSDCNSTKKVKVTFFNNLNFETLNDNQQLHLFRILQELLNNSLKHGKASEISINFDKNGIIKQCEYKDNGVGFDKLNYKNQKGLGMKNIESRVNFLNGNLIIDSEKNKGIKVHFNF